MVEAVAGSREDAAAGGNGVVDASTTGDMAKSSVRKFANDIGLEAACGVEEDVAAWCCVPGAVCAEVDAATGSVDDWSEDCICA